MEYSILIVGEYSGFAHNLKLGFEQMGHNAIVVTQGDAFRKIPSKENDIMLIGGNYSLRGKRIKGTWIARNFFQLLNCKTRIFSQKFDFILIINYEFVTHRNFSIKLRIPIKWLLHSLKPGGKMFLSACGNDFAYYQYAPEKKYWAYQDTDYLKNNKYYKKSFIKTFFATLETINGVIPAAYDYAYCYRRYFEENKIPIRVFQTQFFPVKVEPLKNTSKYEPDKPLFFFHGLTREPEKGTKYIREAFNVIQKKYGTRVQMLIQGKMPLNEYLELMDKVDVIVDQALSHGYGLNAVYGLMKGKVVLSGNEPETQEEYKNQDIPVINIRPDVNQIVSVIEDLIIYPEKIKDLKEKSRLFVENYHDAKKVAESYLKIFKENF